jgi:hypothetical protein
MSHREHVLRTEMEERLGSRRNDRIVVTVICCARCQSLLDESPLLLDFSLAVREDRRGRVT